MPNRQEALYHDYSARLQPRLLWASSQDGTAIMFQPREGAPTWKPKGDPFYTHMPVVKPKSNARKLTEAEDNALARAVRRRQNKAMRGWLPFAKR